MGIQEDTLLIFMSDNGSRARGEGGSNGGLRGLKGETWEGGMRVPFIVRWPGKIQGGEACEGILTAMDLFSTIAEMTGAPLPSDTKLDSISATGAILRGEPIARDTFAYYKDADLEAVRRGDWKLHFCKTTRSEGVNTQVEMNALFNLREDPGEKENLFQEHPDVVENLNALADEFRRTFGDGRQAMWGEEVREIGVASHPKKLTEYDENHPYFVAYYDLADMPVMAG